MRHLVHLLAFIAAEPPPAFVVENKCPPVFVVTNKMPAAPAAVATKSGYPVRSRWWTGCNNWQHMDSGEHRGKFSRTWLASLSWAELQSLHSDNHEGKVNWQYAQPAFVTRGVSSYVQPAAWCPPGKS